MRLLLWISGLLLLTGLLAGCVSPTASANVATTTHNRIVYGLTLSPSGFDPHIHQSSEIGIVLRQVYDTLIYRDPTTGQFVPGLAESWTISEDRLSYEFRLRQGVTFHDGTPFNAQAVGRNLDRITDPETRSQNAVFLLGSYQGYEIIDDYTIRLNLALPHAPLLDSLSQFYLGIASPRALDTYSNERYQFNQVGTGPFRFVEYIPDNRLVIRRNPDYNWGPPFYQPPEQNGIDEVEFRFYTDASTRYTALEVNDVQIIGEIPPVDARALTANPQLQLIPAEVGGQPDQFLMNTQRFPTDNVVFRRALIYATSRQTITDLVYQGFSPIAWGPLARRTQFSLDLNGTYATDIQQARALLASLGYTDEDNDGFLDAGDGALEVVILVPPWGENRQIAQLLQDQWRAIGVRVVLRPVPDFPTLLSEVTEGDYNLVPFNSFGLDPAFLRTYFTEGGARNWSRFSSPDLNIILTEGERRLDPATRRELYGNAQRLIMDQALILPIRERVNLNGARASIRNLRYDAFGWFPILVNVEIEPR